MEFAGNNWYIVNLDDCNNLSENYKMSLIQVVSLSLSLNFYHVHMRVPLIGLEESLQGVEELELNVNLSFEKYWVEKCGVHLIMEKSKADSDIHGEKLDHEIDLHALGSSATDDQRLESRLIRELQKWEITSCIKFK
ncbi:hypothetical protein DKX38_028847 [Salix brachista]|uniref:Uncharacterized protein n=1 Tax=Salix brachista TaxID=2182728 RepID=A0A5N5IXN1_9ROSI|nr:hypothetical protein DKX38_028847 [Salix brachista]